jgi:hypothetical protein
MLDPDVLCFDLAQIDKLYDWMEANLDIGPIDPPYVQSGAKTGRVPYEELYNDATRELIARAHQKDIEDYGWKF